MIAEFDRFICLDAIDKILQYILFELYVIIGPLFGY